MKYNIGLILKKEWLSDGSDIRVIAKDVPEDELMSTLDSLRVGPNGYIHGIRRIYKFEPIESLREIDGDGDYLSPDWLMEEYKEHHAYDDYESYMEEERDIRRYVTFSDVYAAEAKYDP